MKSSEIKIEFDNTIKNLNNYDKISKFRRASIAQRIRKNALNYFIKKNNTNDIAIRDFIDKINTLLDININNIIELFQLDLTNYFEINEKKEFILSSKNSKNITHKAVDIISLYEKNKFNNFSLVIHGSQADGNTTNFSDIDISIFIKNDIFSNKEEIAKLGEQIAAINRRSFYWDNLSHHSAFLNLENDFLYYPESFMPLQVLKKGAMPQNHRITIYALRDSLDLLFENFINILNTLLKIVNNNDYRNLRGLKNLISSYYMLIIIEFEITKNKYLDKKEIFTRLLPNYLDKNDLETFKIFSEIRENWPNKQSNSIGISEKIIQKMFLHIARMSKNIQNKKILKKLKIKYLK